MRLVKRIEAVVIPVNCLAIKGWYDLGLSDMVVQGFGAEAGCSKIDLSYGKLRKPSVYV